MAADSALALAPSAPFRAGFNAPGDISLLSAYRAHDSLFSSPHRQLHCRGVQARLQHAASEGLADAVDALLATQAHAGEDRMPVVGAVPFDDGAPARLWLPRQAASATGNARHGRNMHAMRSVASRTASRRPALSTPSATGYANAVAEALARIERGELDKVVMSRCVRFDAQIDVAGLLSALLARDPTGYTFAIDAGDTGAPRHLLGTSPELLLSKRGGRIVSNPLAGSIPRSPDPHEDGRRARQLQASAKDLHEHAVVVDAVAAALRPWCDRLEVPESPSLLATPTMWHLSTRVEGIVADPSVNALRLALQLHPTPAVCGHPVDRARALIRELEGYDRDLFTGLVGWCDADGDGEWAVTIRCALIEPQAATLYAGAGVVAGSRPDAELAETSAKLGTMLAAMGLPPLAEDAR